jgi:GNAT superfamily N-acetyltransferase
MIRIYRNAKFAIDRTRGRKRYDTQQGLILLLIGVSTTAVSHLDRRVESCGDYAICFPIYSTFQGAALFLEDVYMHRQFRDKGIGRAPIGEVAAMALREGCGALRREVLAWNQPAIDFYKRLGRSFSMIGRRYGIARTCRQSKT